MKPIALRSTLIILLIASVTLFFGCGNRHEEAVGTGKPAIYTTFYPTEYFAKRIGGDKVTVVNPVPEDEDAIFWQPDDATIEKYQNADLIIINGAEFEKWALNASLPELKLVDTAGPFADKFIKFKHGVTHSHGKVGEHTHKGIDGHTWVDPINAKIQAGEIKGAMIKAFPQYKEDFEKGYTALIADLDSLASSLQAMADSYDNKPILTSHPAYNYIAHRYNWNIHNLDLDPEEMPSDETMAEIKHIIEHFPAKYILWESYPTKEIAKRFKDELGLTSIEFSPCELLGAQEQKAGVDYLAVMRQNIEAVKPIFSD